MRSTLDIACARHDFTRRIDILLQMRSDVPGKVMVGREVLFDSVDEGSTFAYEPAIRLRPDEAQQLVDELWRCGVRPSNGDGSPGQLGATERHLEDMRKLVFMKYTGSIAREGCG